jgi:hypothetical protein
VREESHLDDMRAAIRGDFERLARRRGGQELMQDVPDEVEPEREAEEEPVQPVAHEPQETEPEVTSEPVETPEPETLEPVPGAADEEEASEPPRRKGFFARLLDL